MSTRQVLQLIIVLLCGSRLVGAADLQQEFVDPPLKYATRPLWFWNNTAVTEQDIAEQMQEARNKCGCGGFGILPFGEGFEPGVSY
jgi:hypothetical protein